MKVNLCTREQPHIEEGLCTRVADIRPSSINEAQRTIEAVFATSNPARVFHWDVGRVIEEVLVPGGMLPTEQVPMLENHNRYSLDSAIGSGLNPVARGEEVVGTLQFGTELGERVDGIWKRVKQKILRSVSAGYEPVEWVDIQPGQTQEVAGRSYTANRLMLRVTTKWRLREISVVVIPADDFARMRGNNFAGNSDSVNSNQSHSENLNSNTSARGNAVNFLAYLRSKGLAENAEASAIRSFVAGLTEDDRNHARELATDAERSAYFAAPQTASTTTSTQQPTRSADPVAQMTGARGGDGGQTVDPQQIQTAERQRVSEIMRLAGGQIAQDVVDRAINEGWTVDRAGREFYQAAMAGRSNPVGHGGHVGIHSRSASTEITAQALQAGFMMRLGYEPDNPILSTPQARGMLSRSECGAAWIHQAALAMRNGNASDEASRAIEVANRRLRRRSIPDIALECLRIANVNDYDIDDRESLIRRAYTTSQFSNIFTTNFSVILLQGYLETPDSTMGWVGEEDLPDFNTHDMIQSDPLTSLKKKTKNVPGQQVEGGDRKESYAAERRVGTFGIDEVDMINDRYRAFQRIPLQLGASARRIRPDLIYAILLKNSALATDSVALFATAHGNLAGSAALAPATLSAARVAMGQQKRNGAILNITPTHLIVPLALDDTARRLNGSAELRDTTSSTEYGVMNPNRGRYQVVSDARLDAGFVDPNDEATTLAGQPASWFMADATQPGIMVGYVEGSGRAPRIRSRVIDRPGEYGMEWDVNMDIGVGVADYVSLLKRQAASL